MKNYNMKIMVELFDLRMSLKASKFDRGDNNVYKN